MDLDTKISQFKGIGAYFVFKLSQLGIVTIRDLVLHFPFRYDDFSTSSTAMEAEEGQKVTLVGEIWDIKNIFTRNKKILTQAIFNDGTTPITLTWFNSSWLTKQIKVGDKLQISGKLNFFKNKYSIIMPVWEQFKGGVEIKTPNPASVGDNLHTGRLVPVYPETEGLTSKWLRTKIAQVLPKVIDQFEDPLPVEIKGKMLDLKEAIRQIHFPDNMSQANASRARLGFDELFYIQLATLQARKNWKSKPTTPPFAIDLGKKEQFLAKLPFKLTDSQLKVIDEVLNDLQQPQPMNRLIQGEVGSGKTVVAVVIAYLSFLNGYKSLFMAPTEILAFQHHTNLTRLLEPYGINIGIYTGSRKFTKGKGKSGKGEVKTDIAELTPSPLPLAPDIVVGTHALLSEKLTLDNIGLIIVDEQQRFGVQQRSILRAKSKVPHFLTMTATPIPRTVALTLYGDLDLSVIDQLPGGRQKIDSFVVPNKKREDAYKFINKKITEEGDQAYIITPLIEESETMQSAKAAKVEFVKLSTRIFPNLKLGLLHGKLKPKEKEAVISAFKNKEIDILVSTSVVEVGVDIPNATIMMVESAERFGLAQLHQLRGRVGRGAKKSYCLLFLENETSENIARLKNLEKIENGLELSELDLKIRGSGEIFGTRQSGRFELKIASFSDLPLIEETRNAAKKLMEEDPDLEKYPKLSHELQARVKEGIMPD